MKVKVSQRVSTRGIDTQALEVIPSVAKRTPVRLGSSLDRFVAENYCASPCGHHRMAHEASTGACHGLGRLGEGCGCQTFRLEPPR